MVLQMTLGMTAHGPTNGPATGIRHGAANDATNGPASEVVNEAANGPTTTLQMAVGGVKSTAVWCYLLRNVKHFSS